jgi:flagellar biosynthesis/type III secretory pathway protein FliH
MAPRERSKPKSDEQDTVETRPRRARGVFAAIIAAAALIIVTAVVTAIVVDAVHGRSNPVVASVSGSDSQSNAVDTARAAGYKDGVRDTKQLAKDQLAARYDQGFAKGYAKGRETATNSTGQDGGYQDGFNAGVKAAVDAYKKIIEQAQQIIAEANQAPVVTLPTVTTG